MKILMILLFALISVISAALIPRGVSNALRSDLRSFPLKNDKMLVLSPRRVMSNKAGPDNVPAKPNYSMSGIIAGMSLSTALMATYLLNHEDLLSINANSAALIPRGISNALRSNLRSFPFENDKTIAYNPKRTVSTMTFSDNFPAKPDNFMSGIIAGMLLSAAIITTYLMDQNNQVLSLDAQWKLKEYKTMLSHALFGDFASARTAREHCYDAIIDSNEHDFNRFCSIAEFDINSRDKNGLTAMDVAIICGKVEYIVKLHRYREVRLKGPGSQGPRYLQAAIESGNEEVLKALLGGDFDAEFIEQIGRDHLRRAIETGNADMVKAWIFAGIDVNRMDGNNLHYILAAVLNRQRASFDAILDCRIKCPSPLIMKDIIKSIVEESHKASAEEASKMNYPEMIARLYVLSKCDRDLYEFIESIGYSTKDLAFLKRIEPISCPKP